MIQPGLLSVRDAAELNRRLERLEALAIAQAVPPLTTVRGPGGTVLFPGPAAAAATFSGARVINDSVQVITSQLSPLTVLAFNAEKFDTDGYHDNSTNNSRLTAPQAGYYLVGATIEFAFNATGRRDVYIFHTVAGGGSSVAVDQVAGDAPANTVALDVSLGTLIHMAAGDYCEVLVLQNSGGNLNVAASTSTDENCVFWITRLG